MLSNWLAKKKLIYANNLMKNLLENWIFGNVSKIYTHFSLCVYLSSHKQNFEQFCAT